MNNRFSYDNITKSHSINSNDLNRVYKLDRCCEFMEMKYNNPKLTQKEICRKLGFSDSTIKRYRDDINMDSPYRRNNNKNKKPKHKPSTATENISKNENTKSVIDDTSKDKIIEKRIKNRLDKHLKGGNISDTHKLTGGELIERAFNTTLND